MSGLVVDARTLLAMRERLGQLHGQVLAIPFAVGGLYTLMGGGGLETQLEDFCSRWHYGTIEIADQISAMMTRLLAAAEAYRRIEERLATGTGPGQGSGTTVVGGTGPTATVVRTGHGQGNGTTTIG